MNKTVDPMGVHLYRKQNFRTNIKFHSGVLNLQKYIISTKLINGLRNPLYTLPVMEKKKTKSLDQNCKQINITVD